MICEKCGKQADGDTYTFFYGISTKTNDYDSRPGRLITTTYENIPGNSSVNICPECIRKAKIINWILFVFSCSIFAAFVSFIFIFQKEEDVLIVALCTVLIPLFLLNYGLWSIYGNGYIISKYDDIGDNMAIKIKKKALKKQGFNLFLTRSRRIEKFADSMKMKF